jgi:hypothetical protein
MKKAKAMLAPIIRERVARQAAEGPKWSEKPVSLYLHVNIPITNARIE